MSVLFTFVAVEQHINIVLLELSACSMLCTMPHSKHVQQDVQRCVTRNRLHAEATDIIHAVITSVFSHTHWSMCANCCPAAALIVNICMGKMLLKKVIDFIRTTIMK